MPHPPRAIDLPARTDIGRILIVKWSALGDVVIATAAMEDIHRAFPGRTVHLNTMRPWDALFAHDPRFEEVFALDLRGAEGGWRGVRRWLAHVRARRYDLVVDLQSSDRTRLLVALLQLGGRGVRYRMGHIPGFPYNVAPASLDPLAPAHENARRTLAAGGIPACAERPVLHVPPVVRGRAADLMRRHRLEPGGYVVFLPGSQVAGRLKRWGAERYAALGARLHAEEGVRVVLLGGPDDVEECARIAGLAGPWLVNLCGATELLELVPLCEGARAIVGNDTGTAHVASATGRPLVVVCGPTDPRRVRPMGPSVATLQADGLDCINCYCRRPCEHHSCMRLVTPEQVRARLPAAPAGER